ncbi:hypothetical protein PFICI_11996 [Pestalotiopsis fici W106-1]|uniref:2EXR domain-containing protein n=1 Tax=Pestalotiopsis fici (strain W106-1 / CGMCC3.15140) TaxID=1229662 RepID=W3WS05_PESFW|nr:uncharacterized protein PFICI_11996 [Pestalotiopsis fici W106-1]ETS76609.1 hypothetical protein PFICI_11996 [Pestalotiopsis fici W106-1]
MLKATKAPASFAQFAKFPLELRVLVWKYTLPSIGPAIYPYRTGLWDTRLIDEGDPRFSVMNHNLEMFYQHEYLHNGAQTEVPTLLVNHESHAVARAWLRDQHYQLFRDGDRAPEATGDPKNWTFKRLSDPDLDIIYVAPERFIDFLSEEENRTMDNDLIHINPLPSRCNYRTTFDYRVLMDSEVAFDDLVGGRRHDIESFSVIMQDSPRSVNVASSGWWDLELTIKDTFTMIWIGLASG